MREKQIAEMFKDISDAPTGGVKDDFTISTLKESHTDLFIRTIAGHLVSNGYRKQRHGENLTENHPVDEFICSECGLIMRDNARWEIDEDADGDETQYEFEIRFCPRCGVKIKEME